MNDKQSTDKHDEIGNDKLAAALGISVEELNQLDWNMNADMGTDTLTYVVKVNISENNPQAILDKIEGLDEDNTVRFSPSALG